MRHREQRAAVLPRAPRLFLPFRPGLPEGVHHRGEHRGERGRPEGVQVRRDQKARKVARMDRPVRRDSRNSDGRPRGPARRFRGDARGDLFGEVVRPSPSGSAKGLPDPRGERRERDADRLGASCRGAPPRRDGIHRFEDDEMRRGISERQGARYIGRAAFFSSSTAR